jgi:hypothetical protein
VTRRLAEVSAGGRTVRLDPATRQGAVLWTGQPWVSASEHVDQPVRFHEFTSLLEIGDERRLMRKGSAPPLNRVKVTPRKVDEVEHVEIGDWVSGWLGVGSLGEPMAGYARLGEGPAGEVIASFTLPVPEGGLSSDSSPGTVHFLRYDPARSSVDYIVDGDDFGWSLEGTSEVSEDLAGEIGGSWPAVIFQYLIDAYPELDVYPLGLDQAREMGWEPCFDDKNPPPFEHLWRPVDLSAE